jgi:hypothetical protein
MVTSVVAAETGGDNTTAKPREQQQKKSMIVQFPFSFIFNLCSSVEVAGLLMFLILIL